MLAENLAPYLLSIGPNNWFPKMLPGEINDAIHDISSLVIDPVSKWELLEVSSRKLGEFHPIEAPNEMNSSIPASLCNCKEGISWHHSSMSSIFFHLGFGEQHLNISSIKEHTVYVTKISFLQRAQDLIATPNAIVIVFPEKNINQSDQKLLKFVWNKLKTTNREEQIGL